MTPTEAAAKLNGNQYRDEGSKELWAEMKASGLVAVFGASDDLIEFDGAIGNERDACGGTEVYLTKKGLLTNECGSEKCPHYLREIDRCSAIKAKWVSGGFSWQYETAIPHVKFVIMEDDTNYCEGIVFALADVP